MATQNIQLSAKTLSSSVDSGIVDVNAFIVDSEGTTRYVSSSLSLSKTRKAGPILFILSTPRSQTVTATSVGAQIGTFSDISVTIYQIYNGVTSILTLTGLTATSPDLSGIATNPGTGIITLSTQTLANATNNTNVTITATATDGEGTIRSINDTVSLSKIAKGAPVLQLSVNPNIQSVTAKSTGQQQQSFSDVYATVSEIYNNIVSDKTILTLTATSPDISSISTVPAIGQISISGRTLNDAVSSTSASVGATVVDSEGTFRTLSGSFSLSKVNLVPPSLQLIINPASQAVTAKSTGQQSGSFSDVVVAVQETYTGSTSFKTLTTLTAVSSDIPSIVTNPSTGVITLSNRILSSSISAASASVGATVTNSEGTSVTLSGSISLAKVKNARPPIIFTVTPAIQNIAASASGSFIGSLIIDPIVCGSEGYIPFTYASHSANLSGTGEFRITGISAPTMTLVYQQPPNSVVDVTGLNSTINTGIVTMSFVDFEGTPGTASIAFQINKSIAGRNQTIFTISPQSQTVSSTSTGNLSGPIINPTVSASYGTASFTYTSHSANLSGYGEFRIIGVTAPGFTIENTRPSSSVINITAMSVTSSIGYVTMSFIDFDGGFGTSSISFQITKALAGRPNVQFIISPASQTVSAKSTGEITGPIVNPFLSASSGTSSLSYTSGTPTTGQYKIIGITSGGLSISNATPTTPVIDVTAINANSGSAYVTASYVDFEGTPGTASLYFQINKAIAGRSAILFNINPQTQTVTAYSNGTLTGTIVNPVVSASSGTASLSYTSGTPTTGQYKIIGITSGGLSISSATPTTPVINVTAMTANSGSAFVTASFVDFEGTPGTASLYFQINKALGGRPTSTFIIVPQVQSVEASSDGTLLGTITDPVISGSSGTASFTYASHSNNLSGSGEFRIVGITAPTMTVTNTRPSSSRIDVTAVSAATNIAYVTMSYVDFEGTGATASIAFQINKSIKGEIGRRAGSNLVYYQISSSTTPSTPSATSYRFSTNAFTGLTANWGVTPPIYSGSNTYKYWYSPYSANEDSSGADTATTALTSLSFSTPKQAIGFDGLVTFTDSDSVNDNNGNSLSFGLAGATQIIGDNIYTGKIRSTNFQELNPAEAFTSAGVELNLDQSTLRGTGFYIDDNQAIFKGTLSSSAGEIGGWHINPTSITADLPTAGYITIDSTEPSITVTSGSNNETVVSISGLDELTPVSAQSIALSASSTTVSRSLVDTLNSSYGPNLNPTITLYQSVTNYSASITNASQSFTTSATQSGSYTIRVQLSGSAFSSSATITRNTGTPSITSYTVAGTVGVYIRSGSSASGGTTIATLSKAFSTSSLSPGPLSATVNISNLNTPTYIFTQNVVLQSNTTYHIVPFISTTYTSMLVSGAYGNFISASITQRVSTPRIQTSSVQLGVNKIELVAGGFQVVQGSSAYFRARRSGDPDSQTNPFLRSAGNWSHSGSLWATTINKGGGSFTIPHPLPSKHDSHYLIHSFIEGPKMDLIYRGKTTLTNGKASINIDSDSNMTEGTFEVLCRDIQCFTSNETGWDAVKGSVSGNILDIESQNTASADTISWMVVGERKDEFTKYLDITDEDGNLIVEKPMY